MRQSTISFRHVAACLAILGLGIFAGCGAGDSEASTDGNAGNSAAKAPSSRPIRVVCTTNIVKDLVRKVGGDRLEVTAIMDGPGIDPHTYVPSPGDINALTSADVVVYSGLHLEAQMDDALGSLRNRGVTLICATDEIAGSSSVLKPDGKVPDPHVWFSPTAWSLCVEGVAKEFARYDPDHADEYQLHAHNYVDELRSLAYRGREELKKIPEQQRVMVTAHDAFQYFSKAFEIRVESIQGVSTESEPGLKRINELIDFVTENEINAIFAEQSVSDDNIKAIIDGCKSKGHTVTIAGRLYSDTIGADGTPEGTLTGAIWHNLTELTKALAPADAADNGSDNGSDNTDVSPP